MILLKKTLDYMERRYIKLNLAIFGAQGYALGAYEAVKTLYSKRVIPYFMVSAMVFVAKL